MMRKLLRTAAWFFGTVAGIGAVLVAVTFVVNARDSDPSAAAIRFGELYRDRPAVADEDNGFVYLLGFAAAPGSSPREIGLKRIAWMRTASRATPLNRSEDPLPDRFDAAATSSANVEAFLTACGDDNAECAAAFAGATRVFDEWLSSESSLLARYRELIAHREWQSFVPQDFAAPLPNYAPVLRGQRLFLLNAGALAERGDLGGANAMLASDLRFWRNVLASSDTLIGKMIAVAALERHFEWGNLALRRLPPGNAVRALPDEWRSSIADSERSMLRCLTGEWTWVSGTLERSAYAARNDESISDVAFAHVGSALFQPQDSANKFADYYWQVNAALDAPLSGYRDAVGRASELARLTAERTFPPRSLYNPVGALLMSAGPADIGTYAARVADVEGVRRAALAAVTLRDQNVPGADVAASLSASALRDPYDDRPFDWDASDNAIVFRGLQPGARGEHRIYY